MRRQLLSAGLMLLVMTVLLGIVYPLVVTAVGQVAFNDKANGSLIEREGEVVGSELIAQDFTGAEYFHPRPSAAGDGYDGLASAASNLGPSNEDLLAAIEERVATYIEVNGLEETDGVPVDAVTASGSGLDPHISIANARIQARRVADERGLELGRIVELVDDFTTPRPLGFLGEPGVNVLSLNLALDGVS